MTPELIRAYQLVPWDTPFPRGYRLGFHEARDTNDEGGTLYLDVTAFPGLQDLKGLDYRIAFWRPPFFMKTLEFLSNRLAQRLHELDMFGYPLLTVPDSPFLEWLLTTDPLWPVEVEDTPHHHHIVITQMDVYDVITCRQPVITQIDLGDRRHPT